MAPLGLSLGGAIVLPVVTQSLNARSWGSFRLQGHTDGGACVSVLLKGACNIIIIQEGLIWRDGQSSCQSGAFHPAVFSQRGHGLGGQWAKPRALWYGVACWAGQNPQG